MMALNYILLMGTGWLFIVPIITGSISFFFTLAIISIIIRSKKNSVYHRILFMTCVVNLFASSAITCSTLPMPKDEIQPIQGYSYGSIATCQIQGLVIVFGSCIGLYMNAALMTYYLCSIVFGMKDENFRKRVEPAIFLFAILMPSLFLISSTSNIYMNPSKSPYCFISDYPSNCDDSDYPSECLRAKERDASIAAIFGLFWVSSVFSIFLYTVITMLCIVITASRTHQTFVIESNKQYSREMERGQNTLFEEERRSFGKLTREVDKVALEAMMYIGTFLLTWCWGLVPKFPYLSNDTNSTQLGCVGVLMIFFQPLNGFFHAILFLHHKVQSQRKSGTEEGKSLCEILKYIFVHPENLADDNVVSGMSILYHCDTLEWIRSNEPNTSWLRNVSHDSVENVIGSLSIEVSERSTLFSIRLSSMSERKDEDSYDLKLGIQDIME